MKLKSNLKSLSVAINRCFAGGQTGAESDANFEANQEESMKAVSIAEPTAVKAGMKNRQAGLTLIEAVAFLGIAGVVISGALLMYNSANNSQKVGQFISEFQSLKTVTKNLYNGPSGYGAATNLNYVLVKSNRVPNTLKTAVAGTAATITHALGQPVVVTGDTNTFRITYESLPTEICVGLLTGVTGSNDWSGYNVSASAAVGAMQAITAPVDPAAATTACANTANTLTIWSKD